MSRLAIVFHLLSDDRVADSPGGFNKLLSFWNGYPTFFNGRFLYRYYFFHCRSLLNPFDVKIIADTMGHALADRVCLFLNNFVIVIDRADLKYNSRHVGLIKFAEISTFLNSSGLKARVFNDPLVHGFRKLLSGV